MPEAIRNGPVVEPETRNPKPPSPATRFQEIRPGLQLHGTTHSHHHVIAALVRTHAIEQDVAAPVSVPSPKIDKSLQSVLHPLVGQRQFAGHYRTVGDIFGDQVLEIDGKNTV